ncbi:GTPase HflX [Halalkalibacter akibai]|uniref:GTPase HflX n=1 Tax=Halalkalibacter akibai (strain ATCC 43226 / DSM 21942 / CIP 109018 / JCM 9157 / 1139) TaxID=1236973 RepID=W4QRG6_HALA3|nr:GTPase HflX [Halalkalibacter akibai]GAE34700.1 GTP-binding protein HflX [Halalkalibacter akibai JCM 9157]
MQEINHRETEKVVLVGCDFEGDDVAFQHSMDELKSLVETAKGTVVGMLTQKRQKVEPSTYIGRGKVEELQALIDEKGVDTIVFNDELSPSQIRNVHTRTKTTVIDRTQLILDIFAQRARSREGKLQVELAQLSYLLPRLAGQGLALSRQGGGIGSKGPGETQLESDRRHIRRRMDEIKHQLEAVVGHRQRYRERRKQNEVFQVAIVGYTNAGKSTILNRLADVATLEENQLFATLDPTTRQFILPSGMKVLLSDTVGFIQDLPTTLVAAFRSTLEELQEASMLLHVVDSSNPDYVQHERTVKELITDLEAEKIPQLVVYNKSDQKHSDFFPSHEEDSIEISAFEQEDLESLKHAIEEKLMEQMTEYHVVLRAEEGNLLSRCRETTLIQKQEWNEETEHYELRGFVLPDTALGHELAIRSIVERKERN